MDHSSNQQNRPHKDSEDFNTQDVGAFQRGMMASAFKETKWAVQDFFEGLKELKNRILKEFQSGTLEEPPHLGAKSDTQDVGAADSAWVSRESELGDARPASAALVPRRSPSAETTEVPLVRPIQTKESGARFRSVLVVGGLDFLGAAIVQELNRSGVREITLCDELVPAVWNHLPWLRFQEFLTTQELEDLVSTRFRTLPHHSHVFYCGSWRPENQAVAKTLLNQTLKNGGRFVAVSSASSMGSADGLTSEQRADPTNFRPTTVEGVMSCLFDRYAVQKAASRSFLSLKHYRLFGPGERPDEGIYGLISRVYAQIQEGGRVRLPAKFQTGIPEGERRYDFFPLLEAAAVAVSLARNPSASGIYELGSGISSRGLDVVEAVFEALRQKPKVDWDPALPYSCPSIQPPKADRSRLSQAGGIPEAAPLRETVRSFVEMYLVPGIGLGQDATRSGTPTGVSSESGDETKSALPAKKKPPFRAQA
jgi:ADP-L-glycero-D-manno-heptose 6-epimerase